MANLVRKFFGVVAIFIISFCFAKFSLAYSENFDSYSNTYPIYNVSAWSSSISDGVYPFVSSFRYYSSPNSLFITGNANSGQTNYARYLQDDVAFKTASFKILFTNLGGTITSNTSIYAAEYTAPSTNLRSWTLYFSSSTILLTNGSMGASTATTTVYTGTINIETWIYIDVMIIGTNVKACYNGSCSTEIPLVHYSPDRMTFSSSPDHSTYYIDDFYINEHSDNIEFVNPIEGSIQTISDFYWEYQFSINDSSYWTKYSFLNVDLAFFHYTSGVVDATTSLSVYRYPMSNFVPKTTYDVILEDKLSFPDQKGPYQALISLKGVYDDGSSDSLALDYVNFGIATSTSGYSPTAWCSGLCDDLIASSSSEWWQFWDWGADKIGGDLMCAGRYTICYAVQPHSFSTAMFNNIYEDFKTVFPFNTFFDIASTTKNSFASSTMNTNQTFGIPMLNTSSSSLYILPVLSSSTLPNFIGQSNATLFRTTIGYLMYTFTAGLIILIIW